MKNLIKEELNKILNENRVYSDENLVFEEQITNVNYNNYESFSSEYDSEITESNILIKWKIGFWLNKYGIENFIINIENIEGFFTLSLQDKQSDESMQKTQKNINDFNWNFKIENASLNKGNSLYVSEISFDFKDQICTVSF